MGYIKHNAIIVTGWQPVAMNEAIQKAISLSLPISELIDSPVNGYASFFIAPDGSKEGWQDSLAGDDARNKFIDWMKSKSDFYLDWAEVRYGGDERDLACMERHN